MKSTILLCPSDAVEGAMRDEILSRFSDGASVVEIARILSIPSDDVEATLRARVNEAATFETEVGENGDALAQKDFEMNQQRRKIRALEKELADMRLREGLRGPQ